jgi:hypothetical protein
MLALVSFATETLRQEISKSGRGLGPELCARLQEAQSDIILAEAECVFQGTFTVAIERIRIRTVFEKRTDY